MEVTELSRGAKTNCAVKPAINHGGDNAKSKKICDLQESDTRMNPKQVIKQDAKEKRMKD